jgi:hypothetical protein
MTVGDLADELARGLGETPVAVDGAHELPSPAQRNA